MDLKTKDTFETFTIVSFRQRDMEQIARLLRGELQELA